MNDVRAENERLRSQIDSLNNEMEIAILNTKKKQWVRSRPHLVLFVHV